MSLPERVTVVEVGPRDGFQMESQFIPTELKIEIVELLAAAGLAEIEVTSFVHPRVIPQMADAAAVLSRVRRRSGCVLSALVPNLRGAQLALEAGADAVRLVVCASESYNQKNVGLTIENSMRQFGEIAELARTANARPELVVGVAFGCPFEGDVAAGVVVDLARRSVDLGASRVALADSAGLGNPRQVGDLVRAVAAELPETELALHLHDTRGLGLVNAWSGLAAGVSVLDSAFGGLGGCPVMIGATGNIATEDLVNLCQEAGVETGVDSVVVRAASRRIASFLGRDLPSRVLAVGTRRELFAGFAVAPEGAS